MKLKLPKTVPVFPLSGVIFFPKTNLPLNIFEPRYLSLIDDCAKSDRYMGLIQSKKSSTEVYSVGCLGKITENKKTKDGRILVNLVGVTRFEVKSEINNKKSYREFEVSYEKFEDDLDSEGNQQQVYPFETRFLLADGTQITESEYVTRLSNLESVYVACFVGCTYHCA